MIQLFIFLLIALVTIYTSDPERKAVVWYYSIFVPVVAIVFYGIIVSELNKPYSASQEIINCILPALIAGLIIYNHLNIKVKKGKVRVPPALFAAIAVSLVLGILKYNSQASMQNLSLKQTEREMSPLERAIAAKESKDKTESKLRRFSFKGLSFSYPDNWEVLKEIIEHDFAYQIICEKKGINSDEIICITWYMMETPLIELIEYTLEGIMEEPSHKNSTVGSISNEEFNGEPCKSVRYSNRFMGESVCGQLMAFNVQGSTFLIIKQSDTMPKLVSEFKIMEESFEFN